MRRYGPFKEYLVECIILRYAVEGLIAVKAVSFLIEDKQDINMVGGNAEGIFGQIYLTQKRINHVNYHFRVSVDTSARHANSLLNG